MARLEIIEKLNKALEEDIKTECQVVYILSRIRKILELLDESDKHIFLKICCSWALHTDMHRTKKLNKELKDVLINENIFFTFIDYFSNELFDFLKEHKLNTNIIKNQNTYDQFIDLLLSIYSDTPIEIKLNKKYKITIIKIQESLKRNEYNVKIEQI